MEAVAVAHQTAEVAVWEASEGYGGGGGGGYRRLQRLWRPGWKP